MANPRKPADAFRAGERVHYGGREWTVTAHRYLDDKRSVELTLQPDSGTGDRLIVPSGDELEVGATPPFIQRLRRRLGL